MAVVATQVSQPVIAQTQNVEDSTSAEENASDEVVISAGADFAVTSASGLHLNQEFYQIREIFLDDVADPHVVHDAQKLTETDHFRTLFRKVISTNAP